MTNLSELRGGEEELIGRQSLGGMEEGRGTEGQALALPGQKTKGLGWRSGSEGLQWHGLRHQCCGENT